MSDGKNNDGTDDVEHLKDEINRLREENSRNEVFKAKYIDVIGQLSTLTDTKSTTNETSDEQRIPNAITNSENLLDNADRILTDVVTSFKVLPPEAQHKVNALSEEGNTFLQRVEVLEQKCAHTESTAKYALSKAQEIEQYLKIDQLLVHGLKDLPLDEKGHIKKGRAFSEYMANKIKTLIPELNCTKEQILSCISVSHPIKSRKNASNLIALVKFSNRDTNSITSSKIAFTTVTNVYFP